MKRKGILSGIRVIDLTRMLSGPYCTMVLADHGAEVIKIEDFSGDSSRRSGPFRKDDTQKQWAGYFVSLNRSKKSVVLDLKTPQGKKAFLNLVKSTSILIENFRPGVMERLGLSYEILKKVNPKLVYGAIRGFGDPRTGSSPYQDWPSYDVVAQAMGGAISLTGSDKENCTKIGPGVGDIFSGLMMSFGVITALREVEQTGIGQFVDVSMYDSILSLCERAVYQYSFEEIIPEPTGNSHPFLAPFGVFPAKDGKVAIAVVDDYFWKKLVKKIGTTRFITDPNYSSMEARRSNIKEVNSTVSKWTAKFTKSELTKLLGGVVPFGPVNNIKDIIDDPHTRQRNLIAKVPNFNKNLEPWAVAANPLRFASSFGAEYTTPPKLGQHNNDYLKLDDDLCLDDKAKKEFRNALGNFITGVTIVTTLEEDSIPRGFTANSFTSVSLDPPLILVCLSKSALSYEIFSESQYFAINILRDDQKYVSDLFATQRNDKFEKILWSEGLHKIPIIDESMSQFVCAREKLIDAGDHTILIGRVITFNVDQGSPLVYFKGNYFSTGLEESFIKLASEKSRTTVGAILSFGTKVLFDIAEDGSLALPKQAIDQDGIESLIKRRALENFDIRIDSIYAVYWDNETSSYSLFYRGSCSPKKNKKIENANLIFLEYDSVPLSKIKNGAEKSMLMRYVEESKSETFGIYDGNQDFGNIHNISY